MSDDQETVRVSELGTRIVMLGDGSGVQVQHDVCGNVKLSIQERSPDSPALIATVQLTQREALSVVEALVVAAKSGAADVIETDPKQAAKLIVDRLLQQRGAGAIDTKGEEV